MLVQSGKSWTYAMFAVVVLSSALGNLSQTGLNAMMMAVCADFSLPTGVGQWLTTAYMFTLGAVVPLSSFLMGRFRLKTLVCLAIGMFSAGALIAWCAPCFAVLLAGRVVQAVAAGMLLPLLQTIAMTRFPDGRKATAMGISGVAMGFAPNIGPTIGGMMVDAWGWRSFFLLLVVLSACILAFCLLCIACHNDASYPAGLDMLSFVLVTLGFGGILLGCSEASSFALVHPFVWLPLAGGIACLIAFVRRQRRIQNPLVNLDIFAVPSFRAGFWAQCLLCASFMGITLLVPLYVQNLCGGTALDAGLVLLPGTVAALLGNPVAGYLTDKIGVRPVALFGTACMATGAAAMMFCNALTPLWLVVLFQGVRSVGISALMGPFSSWSLSGLRGKDIADGSAFGIAARQTAASVGTALMVLCVSGVPFLSGAAAFHAAFGVSAVLALATLALTVARVR